MDFTVSQATGTAEKGRGAGVPGRATAPARWGLTAATTPRIVCGISGLGGLSPHMAQKKQYSAIDGRTTRHASYAMSSRTRKRVDEVSGWMTTVGDLRRTRYRGVD